MVYRSEGKYDLGIRQAEEERRPSDDEANTVAGIPNHEFQYVQLHRSGPVRGQRFHPHCL